MSSNSFYGRASSSRRITGPVDDSCQPGEYLVPEHPEPDIQHLLSQMQSAITTQIEKVKMSLDTLTGWVDKLESDMSGTAQQLQVCQASLSSSSSSTDSEKSNKHRKKHIAPDTSVSVFHAQLHIFTCPVFPFRIQFKQYIIISLKRSS